MNIDELVEMGLTEEQQAKVTGFLDTHNEAVRTVNSDLKTEKQNAKEARDKAIQEAEELKKQLDEFKIASKAKKEQSEAKSLDIDAVKANAKTEALEQYKTRLESSEQELNEFASKKEMYEAEINGLKSNLSKIVLDSGITGAIAELEADPRMANAIKLYAKYEKVEVNGELKNIVDVDDSGNSVFRDAVTGNILSNEKGTFSYADFIDHLHKNKILPVYKSANSTGARGNRHGFAPSNLAKSKMTTEQKRAYKNEYGIPAYNKLPI
jgi:hypothetical protein